MLLTALALAACALLAAALTAGSALRRAAGLAVAVAGLAVPYLAPAEPRVLRGLFALLALSVAARTTDLFRERRARSLPARVAHLSSYVDSRRLRRVPPALDARALLLALGYGAPAGAGLAVAVLVAPRAPGAGYWLLRWGGGALFAYAVTDAVYALLPALYRAAGFAVPELHRAPVCARSVQEFWGERWNRTVGAWLRATCFAPLARAGHPRAGVALAFAVSAVCHGYFVAPAAGVGAGALAAGYFAVQGALVLAELALHAARWPARAARCWTVGAMVLSSPLFVEPFLQVLGFLPRA